MKQKWIFGLIVVLLVFSLACSLTNIIKGVEEASQQVQEVLEDDGEDAGGAAVEDAAVEDAAVEDAAAEDAAAEDAAAEDAGESGEYDPLAMEELDSYRLTVEFRFENADGTVEEQIIEVAHTREPAAEHTIMTGGMGEDPSESIEIIQVENQQWMRFGEEWIYSEVQEGEDDFLGDSMGFEELSEEDLAGAKYLGKDTVNGIRCRRYEFDETMAGFAGEIDEEVEEAHGEIWIAAESGLPAFMVRYEIEITNKVTDENPVEKFFVTMNVTDVNTDMVIEPPAEAEAETGTEAGAETSGAVGDVPIMANAQNKTVMGDIIVYEIESDFQAVVDFYAAEMVSMGWAKAGTVISMENMLMETWTKDGSSLQLNIIADEDSGMITVTIMIEPSE